jgi:2-polyprenyl-3-methyl-5-hydroxy-6-metoxy-1,4-benzoquinol methylase
MSNPHFVIRDKCPVCASDSLRTIYQSPFNEPPIRDYLEEFYSPTGGVEFEYLEKAIYFLFECNICGLIFQKEIPNDNLMERLYEYWIEPHKVFNQQQKKNGLGLYSYYAQEIIQIIAYFEEAPSSLCFLDFGMGWGKWALMAKAFGCDSYGSELSKERIEYAKSNGVKVVSWMEIPQHQFDFINTEQVFEHIPQPLQTLRHLKNALKPNGILKISVPIANDIERRLKTMDWKAPKGTRDSLNPVAPLEHINFFRRKSLLKMASIAGMEEVLISIKRRYQYTTRWRGMKRIAKNVLLPVYHNILKRRNCSFFRKV